MEDLVEPPLTKRLKFDRFSEADAEGLAEVLADPEISRCITANASTPQRRLACARHRIVWHNGAWKDKGYGVWAIRLRDKSIAPPEHIVGWCGFAAPDFGEDPEILYGLSRDCWGKGLATEAAQTAIGWLFEHTDSSGLSALIFGRLNPGSLKVTEKLGMTKRGTMSFDDFLPNESLAKDVLDYELWRLREGPCADPEALLFQAPYKTGQLVESGIADPSVIETALCDAVLARDTYAGIDEGELKRHVCSAFREGMAQSHVDWYHLKRQDWSGKGCG